MRRFVCVWVCGKYKLELKWMLSQQWTSSLFLKGNIFYKNFTKLHTSWLDSLVILQDSWNPWQILSCCWVVLKHGIYQDCEHQLWCAFSLPLKIELKLKYLLNILNSKNSNLVDKHCTMSVLLKSKRVDSMCNLGLAI